MQRGTQGTTGTQGYGAQGYSYNDNDAGYSDTSATSMIDRRSEQFYDDLGGDRRKFRWNAGADLGLLILRLCLGADLLVRGSQTLFGVLGGAGPEAFARQLAGMGYQQSSTLSLVAGGTELGAGALLVLGLLTPLAAAGVLGYVANVLFLGWHGVFFAPGGIEFPVAAAVMALGLLFTGPGRVALDYGRAWFRHPVASGVICLVIGAGAAAGVIFGLHH
jgi:putative oxidoreductase